MRYFLKHVFYIFPKVTAKWCLYKNPWTYLPTVVSKESDPHHPENVCPKDICQSPSILANIFQNSWTKCFLVTFATRIGPITVLISGNMSKRIFQFSFFWWHPFFPKTFFQSPQIVARKKCEYFAKRFLSNIYGRFLPKNGFQIPPITTFFPSSAVQKQKKWYQIIGQSQIKLFPSFCCFACFGNNTLLIRIWYLIYIYIHIYIYQNLRLKANIGSKIWICVPSRCATRKAMFKRWFWF